MKVKPFLKWAGGKAQLLNQIRKKYPEQSNINRYCEPFLGSGAVFWDIISNYSFDKILLNDKNKELVYSYISIKEEPNLLIDSLEQLKAEYLNTPLEDRKQIYYKNRELYNRYKLIDSEDTRIIQSALFIFLNKTCFNGLYRVNSKGLFNVPMGSYKNPGIYEKDNILKIHNVLKSVEIQCNDYQDSLSFINKNTFVYIDPPYRPLKKNLSFTSYTEYEFEDKQQIELSEFLKKIDSIGAKFLLSNSDPKNSDPDDNFLDEIYRGFQIERIHANRMINSDRTGRGKITEILVNN